MVAASQVSSSLQWQSKVFGTISPITRKFAPNNICHGGVWCRLLHARWQHYNNPPPACKPLNSELSANVAETKVNSTSGWYQMNSALNSHAQTKYLFQYNTIQDKTIQYTFRTETCLRHLPSEPILRS
jgi:hypothetical protein